VVALGKAPICWPIKFFKFVDRPIIIFYPIFFKCHDILSEDSFNYRLPQLFSSLILSNLVPKAIVTITL
jgi:hypothetical protein